MTTRIFGLTSELSWTYGQDRNRVARIIISEYIFIELSNCQWDIRISYTKYIHLKLPFNYTIQVGYEAEVVKVKRWSWPRKKERSREMVRQGWLFRNRNMNMKNIMMSCLLVFLLFPTVSYGYGTATPRALLNAFSGNSSANYLTKQELWFSQTLDHYSPYVLSLLNSIFKSSFFFFFFFIISVILFLHVCLGCQQFVGTS